MKKLVRILREQTARLARISIPSVGASLLAAGLFAGPVTAQAHTGQPFCIPSNGGPPNGCPCNNPPSGQWGCDNFGQHTGGAQLTATGTASITPANDTLLFVSAGENNTSLSIFIQGTAMQSPPAVFGAGIRCVGGILKRMYTGPASSGTLQRPGLFDPDVATRSATPPGPIDPLSIGDVRYYFVYYRDPQATGPCGNLASTFNSTQALEIHWGP
jgi:hypothetical protein